MPRSDPAASRRKAARSPAATTWASAPSPDACGWRARPPERRSASAEDLPGQLSYTQRQCLVARARQRKAQRRQRAAVESTMRHVTAPAALAAGERDAGARVLGVRDAQLGNGAHGGRALRSDVENVERVGCVLEAEQHGLDGVRHV